MPLLKLTGRSPGDGNEPGESDSDRRTKKAQWSYDQGRDRLKPPLTRHTRSHPVRSVANLGLFLLLCGCQAPPAQLTDAERAEIVESVSLTADAMLSLFDAEDPAYFDFYSECAEDPSVSYPLLADKPYDLEEPWWDRYTVRESEMGEVHALVLGPDAVLLERTDVSTVTDSDGKRLEQRRVGQQLWRQEDGEWKVLFEGFQMLGAQEIQ